MQHIALIALLASLALACGCQKETSSTRKQIEIGSTPGVEVVVKSRQAVHYDPRSAVFELPTAKSGTKIRLTAQPLEIPARKSLTLYLPRYWAPKLDDPYFQAMGWDNKKPGGWTRTSLSHPTPCELFCKYAGDAQWKKRELAYNSPGALAAIELADGTIEVDPSQYMTERIVGTLDDQSTVDRHKMDVLALSFKGGLPVRDTIYVIPTPWQYLIVVKTQ